MNNRILVDQLCALSPALQELRRAHIASHQTLIPHVFMGEVLTHVGACLGMGRNSELAAILAMLEDAMARGDRETRNVISISFARDAALEPYFSLLKPLLGPRIGAQLARA